MGREAVKVVRALSGFTSVSTVRVVRRAIRFLAADTPRKTGFAASNWVASVGFPFGGIVGSKEAVSFSFQQSSLASLTRYKIGRGKLYITNNVDYIDKLDGGSSSQAPSGFVNAAINRAVRGAVGSIS